MKLLNISNLLLLIISTLFDYSTYKDFI